MNPVFIKLSKPEKGNEERVMNPWLSNGLRFSGRLLNMFQIRMITCANFPECKFHRVVQKMRRYSLLFMSQKIKSRWKIACVGSYTTHTIYIYIIA